MAAGLRVIRGPDWNLDDDDGGEGHVGTVAEVGDEGNANITWDGGQVTTCRGSQGQGHDLRVLDNATVGIRHPHIVCDECGESGIVGMRWKCTECDNYDLCSLCYFSDEHDCSHQFWRFERPNTEPMKLEKRSKSMKMRVLGIFPDATVERGMDWEWKDQDGGKGSTGRVLELLTPAAHSARSTVKVEWENGRKNIYRLGYKGKVDLQYAEEAPGLECYPQHLPVFEVEHYSEDSMNESRASENITEGDNVIITVGADELQQLQKSRSGWAVGMAECIGKVGKVQGFATNGDAIVTFGNKKYRLYPGTLKKVGSISVGSRVRILDDEEKIKMLQDGHGGYNDRMRASLGKVGEVIKIDEDGDVVVKFGDRHWVFAPACCVAAPGAEIDHISAQEDGGDSLKIRLGGNQSGGDLLGLLAALAQATGQPSNTLFLKIIADKEEDRALEMLRKDSKLAKADAQGFTALHVAANRGLLRLTTALVQGGADLNSKDKDGDTPLLAALAGANAEVSLYLVQKGCGIHAKNNDGQTAGHKAALAGYDKVLQALLTQGADFNVQDDSGDTPLHDAISKSKISAAEVILSWPRIDLHRTNKRGHPPLHFACMKDEPEIAERIVRRDRSVVDVKKDDGFTALHMCACNGHTHIMKFLLEEGRAKLDVENDAKQTPLHVATHEAYLECVQLLVKHGADVNSRDKMGNTPLHVTMVGLATSGSNADTALLLMLLGQSSKVKEDIRTQIACFLIQHGANPEATNNDGLTAMILCTSDKMKTAIERFISDRSLSRSSSSQLSVSSTLSTNSVSADSRCKKCQLREGEILLVPCGHRPLCKHCCAGVSRCPQCGIAIKNMFDKDGKKVKEQCIVM